MSENEKKDNIIEKNFSIKLEEVVNILSKYLKTHNKEIKLNQEDLDKLLSKIQIKSYVSIVEKTQLISMLTIKYLYSASDLEEVKIAEMEKNLFFYVLLETYGNIDCSSLQYATYENYDLLYPVIGHYILAYCEEDYKKLVSMLKSSIVSYIMSNFIDVVSGISAKELQTAAKENEKLLSELNGDENKALLQDLKEVAALNNPMLHQILNKAVNDLNK